MEELSLSGHPRLERWGASLLVVGIPALLVFSDLAHDRGIARFHDNLTHHGPLRLEAGRQWAEGRLPLWNPYKRAGAPLLGDIVAAAFYPPNLAFAFTTREGRHATLDLVAALHHLLASAAAYFFFRTLRLHRAAAVTGALVYTLNGFMVVTAAHWIPMQNAMAWAPLILASLERARMPGRFWCWTGVGAVAYAMQLLCGYPEYAFYTALLAGGFALMQILREPSKWVQCGTALVVVGAGGALLAAPQILTTLEAVAQGTRGIPVPYSDFISWAVGSVPIAVEKRPISPGTVSTLSTISRC